MEYLLVDIQQWITMDLSIAPTGMSTKYWTRLDRKEKRTICLCLSDSVFLMFQGKIQQNICGIRCGLCI